jgi:hypothetical protein
VESPNAVEPVDPEAVDHVEEQVRQSAGRRP